MTAAGAVLVCALDVLGRSLHTFPPIRILDERPPDVSAAAEGFVGRADRSINLIASSPSFRAAAASVESTGHCRDRSAVIMIASIIVHEEWHLRHGPDERAAYAAQLTALHALGQGPDTAAYHQVKRAMLTVLERRAYADRLLAARAAVNPPPGPGRAGAAP